MSSTTKSTGSKVTAMGNLVRSVQRKHWVFTLNNPTIGEEMHLEKLPDYGSFQYMVWQKEKGKEETEHIQGYVEFTRCIRFSVVKKLVGIRCHLEWRRGTAKQARDYCMKKDTQMYLPIEYGTFCESKQGKRTDLDDLVEYIKDSPYINEVAKAYPRMYYKNSKGMKALCKLYQPKRTDPPKVWLFYGSTGTGKTKDAFKMDDVYRKAPDTRWFDGYTNQKTLLLDDFCGRMSKMSLSYLLQLLDRYPIDVEIKGAYTTLLSTYIVLTTNIHPRMWYDYGKREGQYKALARRIHKVWWYKSFSKKPIELGHKSFFEDWFEDCEEDLVLKRTISKPKLVRQGGLMDLTQIDLTTIDGGSADEEDLFAWSSEEEF